MPVSALGRAAATLGPAEAALFSCIHRVAHHNDSQLLVWLLDIKLLTDCFSSSEWNRFVDLTIRKQLVAVCLHTLIITATLLGGCEEGIRRLRDSDISTRALEPSAEYLGGVGSRWRSLGLDSRERQV